MNRLILGALAAGLVAVSALSIAYHRAAPNTSFRLRKIVADAQGGGDSAISPDGTRFLTTLRRSGNWDVWMYDLRTHLWTQLTNDPNDEFEARWSPDGGSIVYTSTSRGNKDVFALRLAGGRPVPLTSDPEDDEYPVFSPDGRSVVFTGGPWMRRRYFLVNADGTNRRAVSEPGQAGACSFIPSGDSLLCHNYDSGTGSVYLYPIRGGDRLRLTKGDFWDYKPASSPDGRWVAMSRSQEGLSAIWIMPFPAGRAFPLTASDGDDRWPTWSADGDKLLFHRVADRGVAIRTYERKIGKVTEIVGADENPGAASFDPAGARVVYSSRCGGSERLRIRTLTTGAVENLDTPGEASFPSWSPDGRRIAFAMKRGGRWDVSTLELATGEIRVWTNGEARGIRDVLGWSPNSRHLVYHASTRPFEADLYMVDTIAGGARNLTRDRHFSQAPAFTKDGTGITFMSTRGGNWTWGFYLLNLASNEFKLLLGPDYTEKNYPILTSTGQLIWSEFDTDGREYLAIRDSDGPKQLLKDPGSFARWPSSSPDGQTILYTAIDHSVEYWIAEGLHGSGSPLSLDRSQPGEPVRASDDEDSSAKVEQGPNRSQRRASPVQMHHR